MYKIAQFFKVSYEQYKKDMLKNLKFNDEEINEMYNNVILPSRSTVCSAGYDFYVPFHITLKPHESIIIPTCIRAKMDCSWVLLLYPRSGLGYKYRLRLDNTVGVIDSDYFGSNNEGHIMIKMTNEGDKEVTIEKNSGICQGVFMQYGITIDDDTTTIRNGGFGSTDKK